MRPSLRSDRMAMDCPTGPGPVNERGDKLTRPRPNREEDG